MEILRGQRVEIRTVCWQTHLTIRDSEIVEGLKWLEIQGAGWEDTLFLAEHGYTTSIPCRGCGPHNCWQQ